MKARWFTLAAVIVAIGVGIRIAKQGNASPHILPPAPVAAQAADENLSGVWAVHRGKAVDTLTLKDSGGVLTGQVKNDPQWGGIISDVHGVRSGQNVEWFYTEATSDNGNVDYKMKGTASGHSMNGTFTALGSFSASLPDPNQTSLWVAERK